jgi:hypothetical protein
MSPLGQWNSDSGKPFVEVGNDGAARLISDELLASVFERTRLLAKLTSPRNQATRYPKTMASFVSASPGGEGIPAVFHRSPFHSSIHR